MMPLDLRVFALMVAWLPFCLPCSMFLKASCFNRARPRLVFLSLWPVGLNWNRFLSGQELKEVSLYVKPFQICMLEQQCPSFGLNSTRLSFSFLSLLLLLIADVICLCMAPFILTVVTNMKGGDVTSWQIDLSPHYLKRCVTWKDMKEKGNGLIFILFCFFVPFRTV